MESSESSLIVLGEHTRTLRHKNTQPVKWRTQGSDFLTPHKTNVELVPPELDATKTVPWDFHVDDSQKNSQYDMIKGQDLLSEIQLDLCFSDYTIRGNGGAYEECNVYLKNIINGYVWIPSDLRHEASFRDGELWGSEYVIVTTRCMRRILDAKYQTSDWTKIMFDSKHLTNYEKIMLYDVLTKYELIPDGTLGTWKNSLWI